MASEEDNVEPKPVRRFRKRRIFAWCVGLLVLIAVVAVAALPIGIQWAGERWLHQQGKEDAQILDVDFNPFTGRLALESLSHEPSDTDRLEVGESVLEVDWLPLLKRRVSVRGFTLRDMTLDVEREVSGAIIVGGIPLPATPEAADDAGAAPWGIGVGEVYLQNVKVRYVDPQIKLEVLVKEAHTEPMATWRPDDHSALRAKLEVNGVPVTLDGSVRPFHGKPQAEVHVVANGFPLDWAAGLAQENGVEGLAGAITADLVLKATYEIASQGFDASAKGTLDSSGFAAKAAGVEATLGRISWDGTARVSGALTEPAVALDGTLGLADFSTGTDSFEASLKGGALDWSGSVSYAATSGGHLKADGKAALREIVVSAVPAEALEAAGQIDAEISLALTLELATGALENKSDGALALTNVRVQSPFVLIDEAILKWDGQTEAAGVIPDLQTRAAGELVLDVFRATLPDLKYRIEQSDLRWQGEASAALPVGQFALAGNLSTGKVTVRDTEKNLPLVEFDTLALSDTRVEGLDKIQAASVALSGLRLLGRSVPDDSEEPAFIAALEKAGLETVAIEGSALSVDTIHLENLTTHLGITDQGVEVLAWLPQAEAADVEEGGSAEASELVGTEPVPEPASVEQDAPAAYALNVGELTLSGENKVLFRDESVAPPVSLVIAPIEARVAGINTAEPGKMGPVELHAKVGEYAQVDVEGSVAPFAKKISADLEAAVKSFDLPPFAPYTERYIGYRLKSGVLNAELDLVIDEDQLDALTKLALHKFDLERLKADEKDGFTEQLGVPVNTALSLLRDKNDDIHLEIPLEGDLWDPDVDLGDAVRQATASAVKAGVMTVFAPVGLAVKLGKAIGKGGAPKFESVAFTPGSTELAEEGRAYLDRLATILEKRPNVRLTLCGKTAPGDLLVLQEAAAEAAISDTPAQTEDKPAEETAAQLWAPREVAEETLLELAETRSLTVKDYLVATGGIDPERLFPCAPAIEQESDAVPRVDVSL